MTEHDKNGSTGLYEPPRTHCPLCGSGDIGKKYSIDRYTPPFDIDACGVCGFQFMNPRFTDSALMDLYGEGYYSGESEYSYYDERSMEKYSRHVWDRRIRVVRKYVSVGNMLDVGCSFGGFLNAGNEWFVPYGIDLSPYAGEYAKNRFDGRVHVGTLEDHPFDENFFSVITMIEVMEHVPSPRETVEECLRLLAPGGLLVIQTANMAGLQARLQGDRFPYYMPGHLSYYTRKNLANLLSSTGFNRIKTWYPVEFGLVPKLKKSRGTFTSPLDYAAWLRIAWYHLKSKIHYREFAMTSSMVVYAFK